MGTLYLREVPDELLRKLRRRAEAERRSAAQEAILILERDLAGEPPSRARMLAVLEDLRRNREKWRREGRRFPPSESLIREHRDR